ncbi:MAG TPA: hypothetical protein VNL98_11750 [Gemmatimonadales bacterium]|nr:hypothetical protein [Gemmatimonadales bacterium]
MVDRLDLAVGDRTKQGLIMGALVGLLGSAAALYGAAEVLPLESVEVSTVVTFGAFGALLGGMFGSADVVWREVR